MQGKTGLKAVDGLKRVAIENGHVMIATFDNDEEIHRVGLEGRPVGQLLRIGMNDVRCLDIGFIPARTDRRRRVDIGLQGIDLRSVEMLGETFHLRRRPPFGDHLAGFALAQAPQIFRQQRRPHAAEAVNTVATGAMLLIQRRSIVCRQRGSGHGGEQQRQEGPPGGDWGDFSGVIARAHGVSFG